MILYFSGTGNSQYAAKQLAELLNRQTVISIHQYIKSEKKAEIYTEEPLIFVAPTYSWRIPSVVESWILESKFHHQNAYFILTCGGSCGNAAAYAKSLCHKKGLQFQGLASVQMPENYLALFPTPSKTECDQIIESAKVNIQRLADIIRAGRPFENPDPSLKDRLLSGPVNSIFYKMFVHDKGFAVSAACISCGKCAQRCPLNNIDLIHEKPVWKGNCTHCMACIAGCPVKAITYKKKSKNRHHHYIMDDHW